MIHEIHRRSLWQVLGIYLAGSWVAYEIVLNLTEGIGLPDWVPGFAIVLLVIGLPVVLATAFVQEGGPELAPAAVRAERAAKTSTQPPPGGGAGLFTWRRAILGGVAAFALLGVVTAGYMLMRTLGLGPVGTLVAQGLLKEREPILLADFQSATGDTLLAAVVTQAFRVDFEQSPVVTLLEARQVRQTLQLMRRPPVASLEPELAHEVAERAGVNAVIEGEVGSVGGGYVLSGRLIETPSGRILATARESAADSTELIAAVDQLSTRLRERIGESLKSLRSNEPLADVTTPSLEALRRFTLARRAHDGGDLSEAIAMMEEAIALDSSFAMAHRGLGAMLWNTGQTGAAFRAWRSALRFQDHLTDRERYHLVADYAFASGRYAESVSAYERLLRIRPDDAAALNNMGLAYFGLRDAKKAEEVFRRAIDAGTTFGGTYTNLIDALLWQGRLDHADSTFAQLPEFVGDPSIAFTEANLAAWRDDYDGAIATVARLAEEQRGGVNVQIATSVVRARFELTRGELASAARALRSAAELDVGRGASGSAHEREVERALSYALVMGDRARAHAVIDSAVSRWPLDSIPVDERPHLVLAYAYAEAGRPDAARALRAEYDSVTDPDMKHAQSWAADVVDAAVALSEDRPADAIPLLKRAEETTYCLHCPLALLGRAHERLGDPEAAIDAYERYLSSFNDARRGMHQFTILAVLSDPYHVAIVHQGVATSYEARGDHAKAIEHYGRLVELWQDADAELQPRVTAARRRLEALIAQRG